MELIVLSIHAQIGMVPFTRYKILLKKTHLHQQFPKKAPKFYFDLFFLSPSTCGKDATIHLFSISEMLDNKINYVLYLEHSCLCHHDLLAILNWEYYNIVYFSKRQTNLFHPRLHHRHLVPSEDMSCLVFVQKLQITTVVHLQQFATE